MADDRNIKFEDSEENEYQLPFNPKETNPIIRKNGNENTLHNGIEVFSLISHTISFELVWNGPIYMDEAQFVALRSLWLVGEPFYIYPNPPFAPDVKFLVRWKGDFDFKSATGWLDGWGWFGKIQLVSAQTIEEAVAEYNAENDPDLTVQEFIELWNFTEGELLTS